MAQSVRLCVDITTDDCDHMSDYTLLLRASPVKSHDTNKCFLELLVGERVAERVDGTVEIADPVGDVVEGRRDGARQRAVFAREADDERQHVPRNPADHERAEDDGDGAQRFPRSVVAARQLLKPLSLRISSHKTERFMIIPLLYIITFFRPLA